MPRKKSGKTLAQKIGVSREVLSRKIQKIREEDPSLTTNQAAGKAKGVLSVRKKR